MSSSTRGRVLDERRGGALGAQRQRALPRRQRRAAPVLPLRDAGVLRRAAGAQRRDEGMAYAEATAQYEISVKRSQESELPKLAETTVRAT